MHIYLCIQKYFPAEDSHELSNCSIGVNNKLASGNTNMIELV